MEYFFYTIIFLIGIFCGSFFTLAVYRIPKKEDILIKHSYCPNCNHRLGLFDLFPVFSYIWLRGKCRYCKNKIRPRYLILEVLTGITFVLVTWSLKIDYASIEIEQIVFLIFTLLYLSILFIVAGIDKENIDINKETVYFGLLVELIYIIYICTLNNTNVYQYVIYIVLLILILISFIISKKIYMEEKYCLRFALLLLMVMIYGGTYVYYLTAILTLIQVAIHKIVCKNERLPFAFYVCVSNVVVLIIYNIATNYIGI